ncbi:hypothetical protein GCM10022198_24700 [Klugiella xanthotipulae]
MVVIGQIRLCRVMTVVLLCRVTVAVVLSRSFRLSRIRVGRFFRLLHVGRFFGIFRLSRVSRIRLFRLFRFLLVKLRYRLGWVMFRVWVRLRMMGGVA